MKKGDYVRRIMKNGSIVGPYLQIMQINGNVVYCDVLGTDMPNLRYLKSSLTTISHVNLCVSEEILDALNSGKQFKVRHPNTKMWNRALEKQAKLVTFYCVPKMYKCTFVIADIYKTNKEITIILSNKVGTTIFPIVADI